MIDLIRFGDDGKVRKIISLKKAMVASLLNRRDRYVGSLVGIAG